MSSVRVIKKYPNRRLYDTEESRYITLSDIRDLVLGRVEFVVVDKKNGNDITRCVLMQVISEQEQNGDPVMSQGFLSEIIRHHDQLTSAPLSTYLEESLSKYLKPPPHGGSESATAPPPEATQATVRPWNSSPGEAHRPGAIGGDTGESERQEAPPERKKAS
jgi:polyhydroxyalkanoate synthesis repressor PhaR